VTLLAPRRRRGIEILDDPSVDPRVMQRSMRDVERANTMFGGTRAALAAMIPALRSVGTHASLLDVGSGRGDIPDAARRIAKRYGVTLRTIGLDLASPMIDSGRTRNDATVRGDALNLPFGDGSVDIVLASQILHHFEDHAAVAVVSELNRVARVAVVVSDLRRSYLAAAGLWLGSFPLGFHPVSRHDGVVSVMRGFLPSELANTVEKAIGLRPAVSRHLGFRLTAAWQPVHQ
jgi:2-polyprenyl-3-methyl-5-hydroxy-6-metoxy-1,4-benzoquinol methylase